MRLFEIVIDETQELSGVNAISIVSNPAIESSFVALKKQMQDIKLTIIDKDRQILLGAALIPNKPILRNDDDGLGDYYIYMSAATVRQAAEMFQTKGFQNEITEEHEVSLKGNTIIETWIKEDNVHDKSVKFGIDAPIGSWFIVMKIKKKRDWKRAQKGELTGFSIEGYFADKFSKILPETVTEQNQNGYSNMNTKDLLSKVLAIGQKKKVQLQEAAKKLKLAQWTLVDGETIIEAESFEAGMNVFIVNGDDRVPLPVGEFGTIDNGVVVVTQEGVIDMIKESGHEEEREEIKASSNKEFVTTDQFNEAIDSIKALLSSHAKDSEKEKKELKKQNVEIQQKLDKKPDVDKEFVTVDQLNQAIDSNKALLSSHVKDSEKEKKELEKQNVELQKKLDQKPDAVPVKHMDTNVKAIDLSGRTPKERIQYFVNAKRQ